VRRSATVALGGCLLGTTVAFADPLAELTIDLEAPPRCPNKAMLYGELRRDLEGSVAPSGQLSVLAQIVQRDPERWQAIVRAEGALGKTERSLTARDCQTLVDAMSLIIAMLIDPETAANNARHFEGVTVASSPNDKDAGNKVADPPAASDTTASKTEDKPAEVAPAIAPPNAASDKSVVASDQPNLDNPHDGRSRKADSRHHPIGGVLAAWMAVDSGTLPSATMAVGGIAAVSYGSWRAETAFGWWLRQDTTLGTGPHPAVLAQFDAVVGTARLCGEVFRRGPFGLSPCAGIQLARYSASAPALAQPQSSKRWDTSGLFGLLGQFDLAPALGLRLGVDLAAPFVHQRFGFYDDSAQAGAGQPQPTPREVFRPASAQYRATGGIELRFK